MNLWQIANFDIDTSQVQKVERHFKLVEVGRTWQETA